jgi:hypothetical protein
MQDVSIFMQLVRLFIDTYCSHPKQYLCKYVIVFFSGKQSRPYSLEVPLSTSKHSSGKCASYAYRKKIQETK